MKLIFKLILLCALIAAVMPVIAPQSPVSAVIRAAAADAMTFCERRPDACAEGADDAGVELAATWTAAGSASARGPGGAEAALSIACWMRV